MKTVKFNDSTYFVHKVNGEKYYYNPSHSRINIGVDKEGNWNRDKISVIVPVSTSYEDDPTYEHQLNDVDWLEIKGKMAIKFMEALHHEYGYLLEYDTSAWRKIDEDEDYEEWDDCGHEGEEGYIMTKIGYSPCYYGKYNEVNMCKVINKCLNMKHGKEKVISTTINIQPTFVNQAA